MFPVLFRLGPFTLHTYGVLIAAGFAAALFYCLRLAARQGLDTDAFSNFFLLIIAAAIVGSRLLYAAFNLSYFAGRPLKVFAIWEGGLVFHGGLILAVVCSYFFLKRSSLPMWETADISAPGIALGQAIGRLGCLAAGCCFGRLTDLPWGITFSHPEALAPRDLPIHPTQLYASASNFLIFAVLHFFFPRSKAPGQVFWLYLILASAERLIEDTFRGEAAKLAFLPSVTAVQFFAILLIPAALFMFVRAGRGGGEP